MKEQPVLLQTQHATLGGILTEPEGPPEATALFVQGGRAVRWGPNRAWSRLARELASVGVAVLRLDYPGVGDSEGDRGDLVESIEEFHDALGWLHELVDAPRRLVIGSCYGGRVGIRLAEAAPDIDALGLLAPLVGKQERPSFARQVRGAGARMLGRTRRRRSDRSMVEALAAVVERVPVWILNGQNDGAARDVQAALREVGAVAHPVEVDVLDGVAIHAFATPYVQDETIARVASWAARTITAPATASGRTT